MADVYGMVTVALNSGLSSGGRLGLGRLKLNVLYLLRSSDFLIWLGSCFQPATNLHASPDKNRLVSCHNQSLRRFFTELNVALLNKTELDSSHFVNNNNTKQ